MTSMTRVKGMTYMRSPTYRSVLFLFGLAIGAFAATTFGVGVVTFPAIGLAKYALAGALVWLALERMSVTAVDTPSVVWVACHLIDAFAQKSNFDRLVSVTPAAS